MKKKNKKIPSDEKPEEYICPAASWGYMTGLIPCSDGNEENGTYDELYPYLPGYGGNRSEKT